MSDQSTRVVAGRYELLRRLGRGGMAEVYQARDRMLDRLVAVKALFPEHAGDRSFVERFRREAQAAARLNHPNIVNVYDFGEEGETPFIVMEYVDGPTLAEQLKSNGPLTPERAADVTGEVAAALGYAHRHGVIHRDIKPGNIMISRSGQVKVGDFGIARMLDALNDEQLTQTGLVMGTATYFSPEQAQGLAVDARSDLYALGVVLYESIVGKAPFSGDSPVATAYKQVHELPEAPRKIDDRIPEPLELIILTLLQKNPAARYQTADDLRDDLRRFRLNQPLHGPGPAAAAAGTAETPAAVAPPATTAQGTVDPTRAVAAGAAAGAGGPPAGAAAAGAVPYGGPDDDWEEERSPKWPWILAAVVVVALLAAGIYLLTRGGDDATLVAVPTVSGPADAAQTALEAAGFKVTRESAASDIVVSGNVISTDPAGGAQAAEGSTVKMVVSTGKAPVALPNVVGQPVAAAQQALTAAGFPSTLAQQADASAVGTVLAMDPAAGTPTVPGQSVKLTVSSGPQKVAVPGVVGQDQTSAANQLGRSGFKVETSQQASATVPSGTVISQNPTGGTQADPGSSVAIVVSTGPAALALPDVVGKAFADAKAQLEGLGLRVNSNCSTASTTSTSSGGGTTSSTTSTTLPSSGLVTAQSPSAGASVHSGDAVTLDYKKASCS